MNEGLLVNTILARWLMLCDGFRASTHPTATIRECRDGLDTMNANAP